jgi:primosomal replication protein N
VPHSVPTPANHLSLHASLIQRDSLRFTPAGVPALSCQLQHESEGLEAAATRKISLTVPAVAFGAMAEVLGARALGETGVFEGFLANRRGAKQVVFHIQAFHSDLAV